MFREIGHILRVAISGNCRGNYRPLHCVTKGERAMKTAMQYPEPEKGGRGKKALETSGFSRQRLRQASAVLTFSRPVAKAVRDGFTLWRPGRRRAENRHWSRASTSRSLFRDPSGPFNSVDSLFEHTSLALQICIR